MDNRWQKLISLAHVFGGEPHLLSNEANRVLADPERWLKCNPTNRTYFLPDMETYAWQNRASELWGLSKLRDLSRLIDNHQQIANSRTESMRNNAISPENAEIIWHPVQWGADPTGPTNSFSAITASMCVPLEILQANSVYSSMTSHLDAISNRMRREFGERLFGPVVETPMTEAEWEVSSDLWAMFQTARKLRVASPRKQRLWVAACRFVTDMDDWQDISSRALEHMVQAWCHPGQVNWVFSEEQHPSMQGCAGLLREIIKPWRLCSQLCGSCGGNQKAPSPCVACWRNGRDSTVESLITATVEDFSVAPVLADALEDAGCVDDQMLEHLRGPNHHCPGCWALDELMGMEELTKIPTVASQRTARFIGGPAHRQQREFEEMPRRLVLPVFRDQPAYWDEPSIPSEDTFSQAVYNLHVWQHPHNQINEHYTGRMMQAASSVGHCEYFYIIEGEAMPQTYADIYRRLSEPLSSE